MSRRESGGVTRAALDAALADLARGYVDDTGAMDWEYLLVTATKSTD